MESSELWVEDQESGRRIGATITLVGGDVVVAVGGGEKPHVGCVVLAQPVGSSERPGTWSASCSVVTIPPHKEEPIARGIATRIAEGLGRVAVVTVGVHDDNLDREGIAIYLSLGRELAEEVVSSLEPGNREAS